VLARGERCELRIDGWADLCRTIRQKSAHPLTRRQNTRVRPPTPRCSRPRARRAAAARRGTPRPLASTTP
jgi:hypothetical protein